MRNFQKKTVLLIELVLFAGVMLVGFVGPGDLLVQKANAEPHVKVKKKKSEKNFLKAVPRLEVSTKPAPVLQGATCGTIGPQGGPPPLQSATNGTIGPPSPGATLITGTNNFQQPSKKLTVASMFLFSIAASFMVVFLKVVRGSNKNALWMYGGVAAALLMITGFIWGNNINF